MGRTRRVAIDGGFSTSGSDWGDPPFGSDSFAPFPASGYVQFWLPFEIDLGAAIQKFSYGGNSVSTVTLWANGVLSLGPATQAQIDFFASGASPIPAEGNQGFPGFFFLFDHDPAANYSTYSFGLGQADYEAPFLDFEAVSAAFFTFDNGYQIVLDWNGFAILEEFNPGSTINGIFIGSQQFIVGSQPIEFDRYPDFLTYPGTADAETIVGSEFNEVFRSSLGNDSIDGGDGIDLISYSNSVAGVSVNLTSGESSGGDAEGDLLFNIEDIMGSASADTIAGNAQDNRLSGLAGNDVIAGEGGDDHIDGGAGADSLDGGLGFDTLSYAGSSEGVTVSLADGTAQGGDAEGDTFANFEAVEGSNFDDVLIAAARGSTLSGKSGDDTLIGLGGSDILVGGFGDDFLIGGGGADILDGTHGIDTASYSASAAAVTINLEARTASGGDANGDILFDIDNIIGTSLADTITGDRNDNRLEGGDGADTLFGQGGNDVLLGGDGNDLLNGGFGLDVLVGGMGADTLEGGAGNDSLSGDEGNDILDGGAGADSMDGGLGDDIFYVDNPGDVIREGAGGGANDRVFTSVSYTLAAGVFAEQLLARDAASTTAINLTGNGNANALFGNAGANILNGGKGADYMVGYGGDDVYFVDNNADRAIEGIDGGVDTVRSSITFGLKADFEVLMLTGSADINGYGTSLDDTLIGNSGNNLLSGNGGADLMRGGDGDDLYLVDNLGDRAIEDSADGGFDTVKSSVSFGLKPNIEVLALTGTGDLIGNGNAQDNWLYGNVGNNLLNGFGGADIMRGGAGDDTYIVDNLGDRAFENSGEGFDTVKSPVSFGLKPNVEVLSLTGTANIGGYGNNQANFIYGNTGDNVIKGGSGTDKLFGNDGADYLYGGSGADELTGGAGADRFYFDTPIGGANADKILDYNPPDDLILLDNSVFAGLPLGALAAGAFNAGAGATEADDRIIYDPNTGALLFDADGNGAGAAIQFATLTPGLALTGSEFFVF